MTAQDRAATREPASSTERLSRRARGATAGAMALQSCRDQEAVPQRFVRLTGSYRAKPATGHTVVMA